MVGSPFALGALFTTPTAPKESVKGKCQSSTNMPQCSWKPAGSLLTYHWDPTNGLLKLPPCALSSIFLCLAYRNLARYFPSSGPLIFQVPKTCPANSLHVASQSLKSASTGFSHFTRLTLYARSKISSLACIGVYRLRSIRTFSSSFPLCGIR